MTAQRRVRRAGFTLVEVLVALAILAITLAAGIRASGALADGAQRLDDMLMAQWCAENALTELRITQQVPAIGDQPGSCEQLGRTFQLTLHVVPTPNVNFRRVDARVADAQGRPLLAVGTLVGRAP